MAHSKSLHSKAYKLHTEGFSFEEISHKIKVGKKTIHSWSKKGFTCKAKCQFHDWEKLDMQIKYELNKIVDKKPASKFCKVESISKVNSLEKNTEMVLKQQRKLLQNDNKIFNKIIDEELESLSVLKLVKKMVVSTLKSSIKTDPETGNEFIDIPLENSKDLHNLCSVLVKITQEERAILEEKKLPVYNQLNVMTKERLERIEHYKKLYEDAAAKEQLIKDDY